MYGTHVMKEKYKTMETALSHYTRSYPEASLAQIFVLGPRSSKEIDLGDLTNPGVDIYIHTTYLTHPWAETTRVRAASTTIIKKELSIGDRIGAKGLIVHLSNDVEPSEVVRRLLKLELETRKTPIFLENMWGKRYEDSYANLDKLKELFEAVREHETLKDKVNYCLDTSHLWAQGFDVSSPVKLQQYLKAIRNYNPIVHLNDNKYERGSLRDEHNSIGDGKIWGEGSKSYLKVFKSGYPIIFERTKIGFEPDFELILENMG